MILRIFIADRRGVAAIEFALLAPAFLMLLIGTMTMGMLFFTASSLHFATEAAARCASVKSTICNNAATTAAFAASNYFGSNSAVVFTCSGRVCGGAAASCGNKVTGTVTVTLDIGLASYPIPLHADACYP